MKQLKTYKVRVGDKDFYVRFTTRAMIAYEELSGKSISDVGDVQSQMMFFYCTAKAGAKSEGKEFGYTFEEFLDAIDDHYMDAANVIIDLLQPDGEKKKVM